MIFRKNVKKKEEGQGSFRDFSQTTPNCVRIKPFLKNQIKPSLKEEILKTSLDQPCNLLKEEDF